MKLCDYECQTTFWDDFTIAEEYGETSIEATYQSAMNEWNDNCIFMTELVMVLNHKIWHWYKRNFDLAFLYEKLWIDAQKYCVNHFTGDKLAYYFRTTD